MFEGILVGLIVFAVGYTLAMRVMARRADVLHGEFIQSDGPSRANPLISIKLNADNVQLSRLVAFRRLPVESLPGRE